LDLDGLGRWRGEDINDGVVVYFNVRTLEKALVDCMLDVGEDVFHGSTDDAGLERGKKSALFYSIGEREEEREGLPGHSLSVCRIATLHSRDCMIPGDLIVNRFALGSREEFVGVEFWRSDTGGFCILGIEFDGLGT